MCGSFSCQGTPADVLQASKDYPFCMLALYLMRKSLHFLSAASRLLNSQTEIVSQRILQFLKSAT